VMTMESKHINNLWFSQRGDTIIEVLIATAIISLTLVSSFAIINRNTRASQDVQEHSYAQKFVEKQIEYLKSQSGEPNASDICSKSSGSYNSDKTCTITTGGADYVVSIVKDQKGLYKVKIKWMTLEGREAQETAYYRLALPAQQATVDPPCTNPSGCLSDPPGGTDPPPSPVAEACNVWYPSASWYAGVNGCSAGRSTTQAVFCSNVPTFPGCPGATQSINMCGSSQEYLPLNTRKGLECQSWGYKSFDDEIGHLPLVCGMFSASPGCGYSDAQNICTYFNTIPGCSYPGGIVAYCAGISDYKAYADCRYLRAKGYRW